MIKHTYFNPTKMWDELSFIKLKLGRVGMGRVLHLGPSWHGPIFMWAELAWAELVLGRVVLHPLAVPLMATDMRMRENDVTLGIPKTSYRHCFVKEKQGGMIPTGLERWPFKMLMVQQMLMHRKHV